MKRALTALLALLLLAGCGHAPSEAPEETLEETPEESPERPLETEPAPAPEGLSLKVEREVYDPSLTRYTYFIYNNTDHTVEFGDPYQIQRLEGDVWQDLTPREDWGFSLIGYILSPGGTFVRTCTLDYYQEPPEAGRYRLLKDMGDDGVLTAEFSLGDSPYTAEAPYGLAPLETLPLSYGAADAAGTGAVLFTVAGEENLKAADEFLQKSSLGAACQLRTVQDFGENDPSSMWSMTAAISGVCARGTISWKNGSRTSSPTGRISTSPTARTGRIQRNTAATRPSSCRSFSPPPG